MDLVKTLAPLLWDVLHNWLKNLQPVFYTMYSSISLTMNLLTSHSKLLSDYIIVVCHNLGGRDLLLCVFNFIVSNWMLIILAGFILWPVIITKHNKGYANETSNENAHLLLGLFDLIKATRKSGMTREIISILERTKVDVNCKQPKCKSGLTLFLCACLNGDKKLLEYMLRHGADVNAQSSWQDSPLHLATFACASQNKRDAIGAVTILLQAGCEVNCKNWRGNTPLCVAASYEKENLIRYLLFQGADPTICNDNGVYPVDFATNAGHREIASLLAINISNSHVWDVIEPHTPPRIRMGLQTPCKKHLAESTFTLKRRKLDMFRTPRHKRPEK